MALYGQTTQGIISGRVFDQKTGRAIAGARIVARQQATGEIAETKSEADGFYALLRLSPGAYGIRVTAEPPLSPVDYQPREGYELELFVAGRMELNIPLRLRSDTYSQSVYAGTYLPSTDAIVHTYAADLATTYSQPLAVLLGASGTLLSTLSYVVDPQQVQQLPLSGRDIYTMLVALPGITADNATARGLGLSVNGQRSSSSNFLLDGVENNDTLLSGPLTVIAPEAVEEYRVSTNNYSAEFGRTSGFVANAITRAGGNRPHGVAYGYLNDTALDANSYQHIAGLNTATGERGGAAVPRQRDTDVHAGFWLGGPLIKERLFGSAAYERFRSRGEGDLFAAQVPLADRVAQCYPGSAAARLLAEFRPPVPLGLNAPGSGCDSVAVPFYTRAPVESDRHLALSRIDKVSATGSQRWLGRVAVSRFDQPDFAYYSVYPGFSPALNIGSTGVALGHLWLPTATTNNELRLGFTNTSQGWDRPHPEAPDLLVLSAFNVSLPGSDAPYGFHYRSHSGEVSDVVTLVRGRHMVAAGGGLMVNRSDSSLTFHQDGLYVFSSLAAFAQDTPHELEIAAGRSGPSGQFDLSQSPDFSRTYATTQFYGFVQDNLKLTRSFGMNAGLRYESFGAPKSLGTQDGYFQPGSGANIVDRLANGTMVYDSQRRSLYQPDRNNWAGRLGIFYDVSGRGQTVLRAAYGIFYDRPFELLTLAARDNNFNLVGLIPPPSYPRPQATIAPGGIVVPLPYPGLVWIDRNLRTPYTESWFGGIQHQFTRELYFEATAQGALGRQLISTDVVNRAVDSSGTNEGRLNPNIPEDISFRSNAASSSYTALTALARYKSRRGQTQAAYTWGHSLDNQSDPLQGTFGDLQFSRSSNVSRGQSQAAFSRQFQPGPDRASSDFDQRHNLVIYSIWDVSPALSAGWAQWLLGHWQAAGIAGFRSGFPFTVIDAGLPACPDSGGTPAPARLANARPSLLPGRSAYLAHPVPVSGGFQLLDPTAFCSPPNRVEGNLGRNSLIGPGFWNVDLSLAKSFRPGFLGESGSLQFRVDFFNAFNHANLSNPDALAYAGQSSTFGQALLGRQGVQPSFPSAAPLDQLPRKVQLQLKVIF
jgi:hypothetical protein